mmetsp:Transcript_88845/g.276206  ORF Transcript_88845/g.276206 Transcript_88845/m.276206 type:complete len:265 (-) Transcript_88845:560-1354(-)
MARELFADVVRAAGDCRDALAALPQHEVQLLCTLLQLASPGNTLFEHGAGVTREPLRTAVCSPEPLHRSPHGFLHLRSLPLHGAGPEDVSDLVEVPHALRQQLHDPPPRRSDRPLGRGLLPEEFHAFTDAIGLPLCCLDRFPVPPLLIFHLCRVLVPAQLRLPYGFRGLLLIPLLLLEEPPHLVDVLVRLAPQALRLGYHLLGRHAEVPRQSRRQVYGIGPSELDAGAGQPAQGVLKRLDVVLAHHDGGALCGCPGALPECPAQ